MKALLTATLLFLIIGMTAVPQETPRRTTRDAMKLKLYFAQGVLEGITMENFSLIATNAQKLKALGQTEDWSVQPTREFERLRADFEHAAVALEASAAQRNVDAATVVYFQLTTTCVTCHRYLRGAEVGSRATGKLSPIRFNEFRPGL